MRFLVVGALLVLNALAIYLGGSEAGFTSSLITVILIVGYLAFSFAREGMWSQRRSSDDEDPELTSEGDDMAHRSRARPP